MKSISPLSSLSSLSSLEEVFGAPIYTYTRAQALSDGMQKEVPFAIAREAGFTVPVFLTAAAYSNYVRIPEGVDGQDEEGRLWDILWMLRTRIKQVCTRDSRIEFQLYVRNSNRKPRLVTLAVKLGPRDTEDSSPAMTVMLPTED